MAGRIPQYEAQVSAQADRRVISTPVLNQDVGEGDALRAVGGAIDAGVELATRLEKANQDRQITTADRLAREKLDRLKFDLENTSPDVADEDLKKRYQEQSEAAIQEAGKTIANPRARDVFTERARGYQSEGALWTDRLGLKRGMDRTRAGHATAFSEIDAKAGDIAIKRETYLEDIAGEKAALERARQMGVYTQEQAAELNAKLDGLAIKDNTMRFGANIDALVKDGRIAEARAAYQAQMGLNASDKLVDRVDPDVLAKINAGLETAGVEVEAVQEADRLWAQANGNLAKYNELVAGEKNVPKRLKMEQRGGVLASQTKAAKEQEQDAAAKELFDWTRAGNDPMRAPPSLLGRFDNASRMASSISLYNSMQAEKGMTEAEKAAHAHMSKRISRTFDDYADTDTQRFAGGYDSWSPQRKALYDAMRPDEQLRVDDMVRETRINGRSGNAVSKLSSDLMDVVKRYAPSDWKIGSTGNNETAQALTAREMIREIANANAESTGGKPMDARRLEELALPIFRKLDDKKNWLEIPAVEMQAWAGKLNTQMTVTGIDNELWESVRARLTAANGGQEPPKAAVVNEYVFQGGKLPPGWN